eukprot:Hpha_TRINITY_DN14388_c0_g1::TRINITY_DN14388_c0_g1_i1::g.87233::m.87233
MGGWTNDQRVPLLFTRAGPPRHMATGQTCDEGLEEMVCESRAGKGAVQPRRHFCGTPRLPEDLHVVHHPAHVQHHNQRHMDTEEDLVSCEEEEVLPMSRPGSGKPSREVANRRSPRGGVTTCANWDLPSPMTSPVVSARGVVQDMVESFTHPVTPPSYPTQVYQTGVQEILGPVCDDVIDHCEVSNF